MEWTTYLLILLKLYMVSADCNSLPTVPNTSNNATNSPSYVSGTVVHFECDPSYNPTGTSKDYECSGNTWIKGDLTCEERFCTYITPPVNGYIVNEQTRKIGSAIIFACNTGYTMTGESQMTCRLDGEWRPPSPPTCQIVMCPDFGSVEHATTFQDNSNTVRNGYGSVTKVTCNYGYIIQGSPNVRCQANGQWENKPSCTRSECPPYPGLNSSCIANAQVILNGQVFFMMCMEGEDVSVTKTGPDRADCNNQQWDISNGIMNCYCDCKIKINTNVMLHNVNSKGFLKHGDTLSWTCEGNWNKETTQAIVCDDGKSGTPRCKSPTPTTAPPVTGPDGSTIHPPITTTVKPSQNTGEIIGIVLGSVAGVTLVIIAVVLYKKLNDRNGNTQKQLPASQMEEVHGDSGKSEDLVKKAFLKESDYHE